MGIKIRTTEQTDADGIWITADCWCHFLITAVEAPPKGRDGNLIANGLFECKCEVRASTDANQVGKKLELVMKNGDMSHKDHGKFAQEKLTRFLFAVGVLRKEQAGQEIDLDERQLVGCSFIAFVSGRKGEKATFYEVEGKKFYHVDDQSCTCPRDIAALKHMPKAFRRIPTSGDTLPPPPPPAAQLDIDNIQL